jgi:putative addiction module component (TIGR02574 family)
MTAVLAKEVDKLSVAEKIQLVEDLWDELAAEPGLLPVPESHKRELDARLEAHLANPDSAISIAEYRKRLARLL